VAVGCDIVAEKRKNGKGYEDDWEGVWSCGSVTKPPEEKRADLLEERGTKRQKADLDSKEKEGGKEEGGNPVRTLR